MNLDTYNDLINNLKTPEETPWIDEFEKHYSDLSTLIKNEDIGRNLGELEIIKKFIKHIEDFYLFQISEDEDINEFTEYRRKITNTKRKDYTKGSDDVLANFKSVAKAIGINKYQVWATYYQKHYDALINYIKTGGQSESEPIKDRISDALNYLELLYAMVTEDNERHNIDPLIEKIKIDHEKRKRETNPIPYDFNQQDWSIRPITTCCNKVCFCDGSCKTKCRL